MSKEATTEKPKIRLTSVIVLGAVMVLVLTVFQTWSYGFKGSLRTPTPQYDNMLDAMTIHEPYFWFLVIVLLTAALQSKLKITMAEYAIIYSMLAATIAMPNMHGILSNIFYIPGSYIPGDPVKANVYKYASPLMGPKEPAVYDGLFFGGKPVPWTDWMPSLTYWILWGVMCYMFLVFMSFVFRPVWIERESLSFPLVQPVTELTANATTMTGGSKVPNLFKNKLLWIGMLISILADWGMYVPMWFDIGMIRFRNYYDMVPLAVVPWAVAVFYYQPVTVAFCYLWPMDILVSTFVLSVILFLILPPLLVSIGFYGPQATGIPWRSALTSVFNGGPAAALQPWFPGFVPCAAGTFLGIVLWSIIRHRSAYKSSFSRERVAYIGALATGIAWLALQIAIGPEAPWLGAVLFGLTVYKIIGEGRVRAEMGGNFGCGWEGGGHAMINSTMFTATWRNLAGLTPDQVGKSSLFSYAMVASAMDEWQWMIFNPMGQVLEGVKINDAMGVSPKDSMKALLLAVTIAVVVMYPTYLIIGHILGERKLWTPIFPPIYDVSGWPSRTGTRAYNQVVTLTDLYPASRPAAIPYIYVFFIAGVIITILIGYLRTKYMIIASYVSPIVLWTTVFTGFYWLPMLIALIFKQLTFRIGGSKMYQEKAIPLVTGIFFGWAIVSALVYGTYIYQAMPK